MMLECQDCGYVWEDNDSEVCPDCGSTSLDEHKDEDDD